MATYSDVIKYIKEKYGVTFKTCWIANAKRRFGLKVRVAKNRISMDKVKYPCPDKYLHMAKDAFVHFGWLKGG